MTADEAADLADKRMRELWKAEEALSALVHQYVRGQPQQQYLQRAIRLVRAKALATDTAYLYAVYLDQPPEEFRTELENTVRRGSAEDFP